MRVASFDIGTNTVLCLIVEMVDSKMTEIIFEGLRTVRLGEGVDQSKRFADAALVRLNDALRDFHAELIKHDVESVVVVATSATRDVENRNEFETILSRYGLRAEILSGDDEAKFTFLGAVGSSSSDTVAVIDVGGGSTEITLGRLDRITSKKSFDVGSVRLFERMAHGIPEKESDIEAIRSHVRHQLKEVENWPIHEITEVFAVAGTPTNLASIRIGKSFIKEEVEGFKLSMDVIDSLTERLRPLTLSERCQVSGLDKNRADVIVVGSVILSEALRALKKDSLTVSTKGLRYGILSEPSMWSTFNY